MWYRTVRYGTDTVVLVPYDPLERGTRYYCARTVLSRDSESLICYYYQFITVESWRLRLKEVKSSDISYGDFFARLFCRKARFWPAHRQLHSPYFHRQPRCGGGYAASSSSAAEHEGGRNRGSNCRFRHRLVGSRYSHRCFRSLSWACCGTRDPDLLCAAREAGRVSPRRVARFEQGDFQADRRIPFTSEDPQIALPVQIITLIECCIFRFFALASLSLRFFSAAAGGDRSHPPSSLDRPQGVCG